MTGAINFNASGATACFDPYFLSNGARRLQTCNCTISPFSRIGSRYLRNQLRPFLKICPRCIYPPGSQPCYHCRPIKPNVPPDSQARNLISATRPRFLEDPGQWNFQAFCKLLGRQDVLRIYHRKSGESSPTSPNCFPTPLAPGRKLVQQMAPVIPKLWLVNPNSHSGFSDDTLLVQSTRAHKLQASLPSCKQNRVVSSCLSTCHPRDLINRTIFSVKRLRRECPGGRDG